MQHVAICLPVANGQQVHDETSSRAVPVERSAAAVYPATVASAMYDDDAAVAVLLVQNPVLAQLSSHHNYSCLLARASGLHWQHERIRQQTRSGLYSVQVPMACLADRRSRATAMASRTTKCRGSRTSRRRGTRPTISAASWTRASRSRRGTPRISSGNAMFSRAVRCG